MPHNIMLISKNWGGGIDLPRQLLPRDWLGIALLVGVVSDGLCITCLWFFPSLLHFNCLYLKPRGFFWFCSSDCVPDPSGGD